MAVELHLPDLPEVPVSLGAPRHRSVRQPWPQRLRDTVANLLPLLVMALLALGSWWLVKNIPSAPKARDAAPPRAEPDYTMSGFTTERFEPGGRLKLRLSGAQMRHFPDTDRIEVEEVQVEAYAPDGRVTHAQARRGLSNGDGSEVQLIGQARVRQVDSKGQSLTLDSEFLHLFTVTERLVTDQAVQVERGGQRLRAAAMTYDHGRGLLLVQGPARMVMPANASTPPR